MLVALLRHPKGGELLQQLVQLHQQMYAQQGQGGRGGLFGPPGAWGGFPPSGDGQQPRQNAWGANPPQDPGESPGAQGPWGNLSGPSNINEGGGTSNLLPGMRRGEPGGPPGLAGPSTAFYGNPGLNGGFLGGASAGDPSNGLSALSTPTTPSTAHNSYAAGSTQYDFGTFGGGLGPQGRMW